LSSSECLDEALKEWLNGYENFSIAQLVHRPSNILLCKVAIIYTYIAHVHIQSDKASECSEVFFFLGSCSKLLYGYEN
jgi:hypothetical protein